MSGRPPALPWVFMSFARGGFTTDDSCTVSSFYDQQRDATSTLHDGEYFIGHAERAAKKATRQLVALLFLVLAAVFIATEVL